MLRPHSGALEIFGISSQNDPMTRSEFSNRVRDTLGGLSILLAIEQAVISGVSPTIPLDNDQILKSFNDQIYCVPVTRLLQRAKGRRCLFDPETTTQFTEQQRNLDH
jgi:hypothetical protein